jgi:hypothetical protein
MHLSRDCGPARKSTNLVSLAHIWLAGERPAEVPAQLTRRLCRRRVVAPGGRAVEVRVPTEERAQVELEAGELEVDDAVVFEREN